MENPKIVLNEVSLEDLREKFHQIWLKSSGWRYELGEVLSQIKEKCEHGQWGDFLAEYDLPRSSADDYIRCYKNKLQIAESRQFEEPNPEPAPDPEAEERREAIATEAKSREGKKREHHPTEVRVKLKDLQADEVSLYWKERESNADRVNMIWRQAFLTIIRAEMVTDSPLADDAPIRVVVSENQEAVC